MSRINYRRVVAGGLLAGVVLAISELILSRVFEDRLQSAMDLFGVPPPTGWTMSVYVIALLVLGIALVWVYAAIRPRFGPGPGTAVCAGLIVWFLVWVWCFALMALIWGMFPGGLVAIMVIWGLAEVVLAAVAGAWVYREAEKPRTAGSDV